LALDIGIVGAGFAGCAAALLLTRSGHRVTLYEEAAEPGAIGAGIMIQPTGQRVLAELGLLGAALERGSMLGALLCQTAQGRAVLDLQYADFEPGWFGLGMHRGALFELLLNAVRAEGIALECNTRVHGLQRRGGRVRPTGEEGEALAEHELLVLADGARSELREAEFPGRAKRYPWGALWFVARDPEQRFRDALYQVTDGTTTLVGFLPSGKGPAGTDGTPLVSLFWSLKADAAERRAFDLPLLKRRILELEPRADAVLAQITEPADLLPATYLDVVLPRWHAERVLFIGDAGHAMSPQLGQGCNLALEDARVLDLCLNEESELQSALARYSLERKRHLAYYQFASRALTPFFQSRYRSLGLPRDLGLGALCHFPPTRRLMLGTLAGVQRGFVRTPLPLEPIRRALAR
jgi:2-polyprenyl-6-methoxyphenol hydroxylase-like FAD-dependent oxidoreductase